MRIKASYQNDGRPRNYRNRITIQNTILAGRYLASLCKADINKTEYGLEEIKMVQEAFDEIHPRQFNIMVYKNDEKSDLKLVYTGNRNNSLPVLILCLTSGSTSDFFGLKNKFLDKD